MVKVILITVATVMLCVILGVFYVKEQAKKREYDRNNSVRIFGYMINDKDFFSLCNTLVAYIMCYREIDLRYFLNLDYLRITQDEDFHIIENIINMYPCIACKYIGNYTFRLDEEGVSKKCEKYQQETGNDDYIVPLFEIGLIERNEKFFNVQTRYQQLMNMKSIMCHDIYGYHFDNPEQTQKELDKVEDHISVETHPRTTNMVVQRIHIQ